MDREASAQRKRLHRCGWAWVVPNQGSDKNVRYGARRALGGLQTVPRAELRAIHQCLSSIKEHKHIRELIIYSECKKAVDGIAKDPQHISKTKLGQLWTCVWDEYEACIRSGIQGIALKVKSHEKDTNSSTTNIARWQYLCGSPGWPGSEGMPEWRSKSHSQY